MVSVALKASTLKWWYRYTVLMDPNGNGQDICPIMVWMRNICDTMGKYHKNEV